MQLGELQQQLEAFREREVTLVAISVDLPSDAAPMVARMGLEFPLLSDAEYRTIRSYGIENPEVGEMALHATFIVDSDRRVLYRKIARRRPFSVELLDAVDFRRGTFVASQHHRSDARPRPWKGWNLLDAVNTVLEAPPLPSDLSPALRSQLAAILVDLRAAHEDPALRKWRNVCRALLGRRDPMAVAQLGHRLMREAYLDGLDYEEPRQQLQAATKELTRLRLRRSAAVAEQQSKIHIAAIELEIGAARNNLQVRAAALGSLSRGHLRSLWDLKSMLKAMDELHAAEARRRSPESATHPCKPPGAD